jgi:manganese/iron transport system permease protein
VTAADWIAEPWRTGLVQHAAIELGMVAVVGGVIGVFVVVRGLAFTGEAFGHAIFPGAVIAYMLAGSIALGSLACALAAAALVALVSTARELTEDTAVGVVFSGAFALGAVLLATVNDPTRDLNSFLFGSLLGVSREDLVLTAVVAGVVLLALAGLWRPLVLSSFDPVSAAAAGVRLVRVNLVLLVLLAMTTVIAVQAIGNVLVLAILVTPAVTARLLCRRLLPTVLTAVALGWSAALIGIYLSWYRDLAAGASVVMAATGQLVLAALLSPRAGALSRLLRAPRARPA